MSAEGIVLVTGGSRGIGAATATLLAEQGRRVVVTDIAPEPLAGTQAATLEGAVMERDQPARAMVVLALTVNILAQQSNLGYDDTPMQPNGKWHIHDGKRPQPIVVSLMRIRCVLRPIASACPAWQNRQPSPMARAKPGCLGSS